MEKVRYQQKANVAEVGHIQQSATRRENRVGRRQLNTLGEYLFTRWLLSRYGQYGATEAALPVPQAIWRPTLAIPVR